MTIVIVAFRDSPDRAVAYKKFTDIQQATAFYGKLLKLAQCETEARKPRVISTRIILDET